MSRRSTIPEKTVAARRAFFENLKNEEPKKPEKKITVGRLDGFPLPAKRSAKKEVDKEIIQKKTGEDTKKVDYRPAIYKNEEKTEEKIPKTPEITENTEEKLSNIREIKRLEKYVKQISVTTIRNEENAEEIAEDKKNVVTDKINVQKEVKINDFTENVLKQEDIIQNDEIVEEINNTDDNVEEIRKNLFIPEEILKIEKFVDDLEINFMTNESNDEEMDEELTKHVFFQENNVQNEGNEKETTKDFTENVLDEDDIIQDEEKLKEINNKVENDKKIRKNLFVPEEIFKIEKFVEDLENFNPDETNDEEIVNYLKENAFHQENNPQEQKEVEEITEYLSENVECIVQEEEKVEEINNTVEFTEKTKINLFIPEEILKIEKFVEDLEENLMTSEVYAVETEDKNVFIEGGADDTVEKSFKRNLDNNEETIRKRSIDEQLENKIKNEVEILAKENIEGVAPNDDITELIKEDQSKIINYSEFNSITEDHNEEVELRIKDGTADRSSSRYYTALSVQEKPSERSYFRVISAQGYKRSSSSSIESNNRVSEISDFGQNEDANKKKGEPIEIEETGSLKIDDIALRTTENVVESNKSVSEISNFGEKEDINDMNEELIETEEKEGLKIDDIGLKTTDDVTESNNRVSEMLDFGQKEDIIQKNEEPIETEPNESVNTDMELEKDTIKYFEEVNKELVDNSRLQHQIEKIKFDFNAEYKVIDANLEFEETEPKKFEDTESKIFEDDSEEILNPVYERAVTVLQDEKEDIKENEFDDTEEQIRLLGDDLVAVDAIRGLSEFVKNKTDLSELVCWDKFKVTDKNNGSSHTQMVYLFKEIILLTDIQMEDDEEQFYYIDHIPLQELGLTELEDEVTSFEISSTEHEDGSYILSSKPVTKKDWIHKIKNLLEEMKTKDTSEDSIAAEVTIDLNEKKILPPDHKD